MILMLYTGGDYNAVLLPDTFPTDSTELQEICFLVDIIDDSMFENTEDFNLVLQAEGNVAFEANTALVVIVDDEGIIVLSLKIVTSNEIVCIASPRAV